MYPSATALSAIYFRVFFPDVNWISYVPFYIYLPHNNLPFPFPHTHSSSCPHLTNSSSFYLLSFLSYELLTCLSVFFIIFQSFPFYMFSLYLCVTHSFPPLHFFSLISFSVYFLSYFCVFDRFLSSPLHLLFSVLLPISFAFSYCHLFSHPLLAPSVYYLLDSHHSFYLNGNILYHMSLLVTLLLSLLCIQPFSSSNPPSTPLFISAFYIPFSLAA